MAAKGPFDGPRLTFTFRRLSESQGCPTFPEHRVGKRCPTCGRTPEGKPKGIRGEKW